MGLRDDGRRATVDDIEGAAQIPIFTEAHLEQGSNCPSLVVLNGNDWKILKTTASGKWPRAIVDRDTGNYLIHTFPGFNHKIYEVDLFYDTDDGLYMAYYGVRDAVVASVTPSARRLTYEELTVEKVPESGEPPLLITKDWSAKSPRWGPTSVIKRIDNLTLDLAVGEAPFKWSRKLEEGADAVIDELGLRRSRERRQNRSEPRGNPARAKDLHEKFRSEFL
ncbi:hypothetical protein [Haloferax sp. Atlit-4N]|uniref:hypothetical protein n=1 Tax=Haloferax sp. Atlit-4N TaxID=2077206 RepID=UPI0011C02F96|nr:hypothetical protein [Haloferax sp. Atlit-4N]